MITQDVIVQKRISEIIHEDANLIYDTQAAVIRENFPPHAFDKLTAFLSSKPFYNDEGSGKSVYYFRVFTYLRLLDIWCSGRGNVSMAVRRNLALYNRVIWGVLYHETFPDIRYGITSEMRKSIKAQLQSAVEP